MPRKSRQKRIQDTKDAINLWSEAGLGNDYQVRFMSDMLRRLEAGRGISKKQRTWLDAIHADGPPEPKGDLDKVAKIDDAIKVLAKDNRAVEALTSFRGQVYSGRNLSEKQESFLNVLLAKADHIHQHGHYRPTEEQVQDLRVALAVCRARISWIGQNKPGTYKAYEKINSWMVSEELLSVGQIEENLFIIDEWALPGQDGRANVPRCRLARPSPELVDNESAFWSAGLQNDWLGKNLPRSQWCRSRPGKLGSMGGYFRT